MTKRVIAPALLVALPALAAAQGPPPQRPPRSSDRPTMVAPQDVDPSGPRIDVAEKIKDYGVVAKGDKITAVFEVKNLGKQPLQINQVRPTCGCTVADFDKTIEPGKTGKIHAEVDTSGFLGPISKAVLVYSNDTTTPQVNLVIKADVRAYIEVKPRAILRFNVLQGEPAVEKVTLVAAEGGSFKVTGIDTGGGPYTASYRELDEKERQPGPPGSQWQVEVTVPAEAPEGLLNHKLEVKTTSEKAPLVPITVTGVVRPIIQVIPPEINFGTIPSDAPVGRNLIVVNNREGSQLEIKGAELDTTDFSVEIIPLEAGQRFQLAVTLPAGAAQGEHKGVLTINTNDPSRGTVKVPVIARVQ